MECSIKSDTQARKLIKRAMNAGHIEPYTVKEIVDYHERDIRAFHITPEGIRFLRQAIPNPVREDVMWFHSFDANEENIYYRSRGVSKTNLIRFMNVAATSMFMAGMGASVLDAFPEEYDPWSDTVGVIDEVEEGSILDDLSMTYSMEGSVPLEGDILLSRERQRAATETNDAFEPLQGQTEKKHWLSYVVREAKCSYYGVNQFRNKPVLNADSNVAFINSHAIKYALTKGNSNEYEYRRDRMTGIVTSPLKSALVYFCSHGVLTWRRWNYLHEARSLYHYVMRYGPYPNVRDSERTGIVIVNSPKDMERMYRPYLKAYEEQLGTGGNTIELGTYMDSFLIVPLDRNGTRNCWDYMTNDVDEIERDIVAAGYHSGLLPGPVKWRTCFPMRHPDGSYVSVGIFMDIIRINQLQVFRHTEGKRFGIMCYQWQIEYYKRLFPDCYYLIIKSMED